MIIILILIFLFIGAVLFIGFANEEPEVKIGGLTFFISLFLVGPFFSGILSVYAPIPLDAENTIDLVSIFVAIAMSAIAVGIYRMIDNICSILYTCLTSIGRKTVI